MITPNCINTILIIILIIIAAGILLLELRKAFNSLRTQDKEPEGSPDTVRQHQEEQPVLDSLPNAVIRCTSNGTIQMFNIAANTLYGNRLTIGDNIYNYLLFKLPNPEELEVKKSVDLIDEIDFSEMGNPQYSGTETFSYSIKLEGGRITITITNISKSKIIENKMSNLYIETRAVIDSVPSAMELFSSDGSFVYANKAFVKMFGISEDRDVDSGLKLWDNPAYNQSLRMKLHNDDEGEANIKIDFSNPVVKNYYRTSNNDTKYFNIYFRKIYSNSSPRPNIIVVSNDISLLEKRNKELQGVVEMAKIIHNYNVIRMWGLNPKTKMVKVFNEAGLKKEVTSDEFFSAYLPQDIVPFKDAIQKILEGRTDNIALVVRIKDDSVAGGHHYWNITMHPVIVNGEIVEIRGNNLRITYKTLYTKLNETRKPESPKKSDNNATQFVYNVETNEFTMAEHNRTFKLDDYLKNVNPLDLKTNQDVITGIKNGKAISAALSYRFKTISKWHTMQFSISPKTKDENGKVTMYEGAVTTNLKWDQLVNTVEESDKLLKSILNNAPCMITIKDPDDDFRYLVANNIFCSTMDADNDLIVRHTDYEIFGHSQTTEQIYKHDAETLEKGSLSFDIDMVRNGARLTLHVRKVLFSNSKNQKFIITSALNLTKLNSTIAQLKEAKNNAERSDKLKSAFLANMSHEIRTPLNAICGFGELLIKATSEDKRTAYSKLINVNTDYLLKLISDILDISKIEAGYVSFSYERFNIAKLYADIHESYMKRKLPDVDIILESPYPYCIINSDIRRTKQIISNYVSNSMKYTKSGHIKMGYRYQDNGIYIYVEDTGCGIQEQDKPKIFGRFEKLNPYVQGTGLGLALCKAIAESAGGYVGFKSEYGKGSTFWAWIPCEVTISDTMPVNYETSENSASAIRKASNKRILVAEDDDSNYSLLYVLLKDNYKVDRATDGQEAIRMSAGKDYGLIFMDIKMPTVDGLEATRAIRRQGVKVPIIAITAYAYQTDKQAAIEAGCNEFIPKPINIKKLRLVIEKYGIHVGN